VGNAEAPKAWSGRPLIGAHAVRVADSKPIVRHLAAVPDRIATHSQECLLNPGDDLPVVSVAARVAALRPHLAQLALPQLIVVAVVVAVWAAVPVPILCRFHFDLVVLGNSVVGVDGGGKNLRLLVVPFVEDALGFGGIVVLLNWWIASSTVWLLSGPSSAIAGMGLLRSDISSSANTRLALFFETSLFFLAASASDVGALSSCWQSVPMPSPQTGESESAQVTTSKA